MRAFSNTFLLCSIISPFRGYWNALSFSTGSNIYNQFFASASTTSMSSSFQNIILPELPYSYDALEPHISKDIMELHHKKHHQAYVNGYNTAMNKLVSSSTLGDPAAILSLLQAIKFNGGGYVNHSLFWKMLIPSDAFGPPSDHFKKVLNQRFNVTSFDNFKGLFSTKALGIQGSGWCWLCWNKESNSINIITTSNQDTPTNEFVPLLGIDVWEHAYYLQYKNERAKYLDSIWNIINWEYVEGEYNRAISTSKQ